MKQTDSSLKPGSSFFGPPLIICGFHYRCERVPTEHALVVDVLDAEPEACWESADQDVEVKEEGDPRGRLVLRHGGDDGDVDLCIAVQEGGCN